MTISIDELELVAAEGWRATERAPLGSWTLRAAEGFTSRANSALAVGDPGLPLPEAVDRVREWYRVRGLPAMVAVAFPRGRPEHNVVDRFLAQRGWPVHRSAMVMTAVPGVIEPASDTAISLNVTPEPDNAWFDLYRYRGGAPPPISRRLLTSAPWQAFASARTAAGQTVAVGRVAVTRGWAGLTAIAVHPEHRRRGLGRLVTTGLACAAAERGAEGLYLQVENGNAAAHALYRGIGFTDHHGYHFRVEPVAELATRSDHRRVRGGGLRRPATRAWRSRNIAVLVAEGCRWPECWRAGPGVLPCEPGRFSAVRRFSGGITRTTIRAAETLRPAPPAGQCWGWVLEMNPSGVPSVGLGAADEPQRCAMDGVGCGR